MEVLWKEGSGMLDAIAGMVSMEGKKEGEVKGETEKERSWQWVEMEEMLAV